MKFAAAFLAIAVTGAASAQTPQKPPAQPREKPFVFQMPKDFQAPTDKDGKPFVLVMPKDYAGLPDKDTGPKKAPPGQLCLLKVGDERCPQVAELIRKPYEPGDGDLYLLDREPGKQKMILKTVPLTDKLKEKAD
ncbi:MAG TPA: hypothetical protein VGO52_00520 [Hyphomonadaceae bacterium]|jgi:hypothetical protein|nr:hypothetical protein [Hyphomonadaceae bacterium]